MSKYRTQALSSRKLQEQKNKVRGLFGLAHSRGRNSPDPDTTYRLGVRTALLSARQELAQEERIAFLNWLETLIRAEGQKPRRAIAFDLVHPMIRSRRLSVSREIEWLIARIGCHCRELRRFRNQAVLLNEAFWRGDCAQVWELLRRSR